MASGRYNTLDEISWSDDDDDDAEEGGGEDPADDWKVVQKKKGKKSRKGPQYKHYNPNDEIIRYTGQESWFRQTSVEPLVNGTAGPSAGTVTRPSINEKRGNQVKNGSSTQYFNPNQEIIQKTGQDSWFEEPSEEFIFGEVADPATEISSLPSIQPTVLSSVWKTSKGQQQSNSQHLTHQQNGTSLPQRNSPHVPHGLQFGVNNAPASDISKNMGPLSSSLDRKGPLSSSNQGPVLSFLDKSLQSYKFRLGCEGCFTENVGMYGNKGFTFHQKASHVCAKNLLLCLLKNPADSTPVWGLIRPRTNPAFMGQYQLCYHFTSERPCTTGTLKCHFAHSLEEKSVWEAEREGRLDRRALMDNLSQKSSSDVNGTTTYQKPHTFTTGFSSSVNGGTSYAGVSSSRVSNSSSPSSSWLSSSSGANQGLMDHLPKKSSSDGNGATTYQTRHASTTGFSSSVNGGTSYAGVSYSRVSNSSSPSSSWLPSSGANQGLMDHLPQKSSSDGNGATTYQTRHASTTGFSSSVNGGTSYAGISSSGASNSSHPSSSWMSSSSGTNHVYGAGIESKEPSAEIELFHFPLRVVCKPCYDKGENIESREKFNYCSVPNDHKGKSLTYLLKSRSGFWMQVRARPTDLAPQAAPVMCRWAPNCKHEERTGTACRFPHYQEEIHLWNYQLKYGFHTIEEVLEVSRNRRPAYGSPLPTPIRTPYSAPASAPAATPASVSSPASASAIASSAQTWKYREPPYLPSGNYRRCKYDLSNRCSYSRVDDRFNFCRFAHSDEELEEWKLRHSIKHRANNFKSNNWTVTSPPPSPKQNVDHVTGSSDSIELSPRSELTPGDLSKLTVYLPISSNPHQAFYSYHWNFKVHRSKLDELHKLGLVSDNAVRRHFILKEPTSETDPVFSVVFMSTVPGQFQQKLQYDFRNGPSRVLTMTVSISTHKPPPQVTVQPREPAHAHVIWNTNNSCIVPYSISSDLDPLYEKLLEDYPPPQGKVVIPRGETLREDNFKEYFHKMIYLEEEACNEKISKFGCQTEISLSKEIMDGGVYLSAQDGELFGKLKIRGGLLDSSDASQIVSRMAKFVLLKFKESSETVFQTKILVTNDVDLRQDDCLYVSIGKICVQTEGLKAKTEVKVQMQFEVDRTWFCSMHYGVDQVKVPELVFPPHALQKRFPGVRKEECKDMNPKQEDAARYILRAGKDQLPFQPGPTLIIGPFGTGKTHALAKIVMRLLLTSRDSRILIATHTNSAADWYITEYLHDFLSKLKKNNTSFLLRVYSEFVHPARVEKTILDCYSLMTDGQREFVKPCLNDVASCRVVITTLATSIHLVNIPELRGQFTHIFIDEAGHALETETMIPLGLAGPRTVVVLAGDHKQMRPKVFSEEGQRRLFQRSMIERLSILNRIRKCGNTCFLTFNYRMRPEILDFISNFYEGTQLIPKGNHERHPDFYPISFGVVEGKDEARGISYVNGIEAGLVVAQIKLLVDIWPSDLWGEFSASDVAVLTPYTQQEVEGCEATCPHQVFHPYMIMDDAGEIYLPFLRSIQRVKHIRSLLRREKLGGVTVERVQNVQGKQFKVVFISPVRARNTLQANLMASSGSSNQSELPKEDIYYGFLSDEGELITAFTRSQCLLFVIGDPVALCGVGECQKIWERYIGECEANGSLFPEGTTLKDIMMEVQFSSSAVGVGPLYPYVS